MTATLCDASPDVGAGQPLLLVWSFGYGPAVQMYRSGHSSPRYSLVRSLALGLLSIFKEQAAYLHRPAGKTLIIVDQPQREY